MSRMCAAKAELEPWGTVYCTKSRGHHGDHHAYDAFIDYHFPQRGGRRFHGVTDGSEQEQP